MIEHDILSTNGVVLNEFMASPISSTTETDGEWIELYNNTGEWINLSGWKLANNLGQEIVLSTYLLPPDGFFVIAACGNPALNGGISPDFVYGTFTINNTGSIEVYDSSMNLIDEIEYDGRWPIRDGVSCERVNPGWVAGLASSWGYARQVYGNGDLGTPGSQNSVYENSFAQNSWAFIKAFVQ